MNFVLYHDILILLPSVYSLEKSHKQCYSENYCAPLPNSHLSFNYPIHNCLQRFQLITFHNTFKILRAMLESLCHCDIQVIISFFSSKILEKKRQLQESIPLFMRSQQIPLFYSRSVIHML